MTSIPSESTQRLQAFVTEKVLREDTLALTDAMLALTSATAVSDDLLLAAALAVRAPIEGSACVDLASIAHSAAIETAPTLPWPAPAPWIAQMVARPDLVRSASAPVGPEPLVLDGSRLYLARLWSAEQAVAAGLVARADGRLRVLVGGPGSGKTTRIAADLLHELRQDSPPRVALAAPTGKAAARMREALTTALQRSAATPAEVERVLAARVGTLHRLLRLRPGRLFADGSPPVRVNEDLLIVDEASMVSLPLLERLLAALAPHTRLWLVGDPHQLASVEVGSVLADIVGPSGSDGGALAPVIEPLTGQHRFAPDAGIARFAAAVRDGDGEQALAILREGREDLVWVDPEAAGGAAQVEALVAIVADHARLMAEQALAGDVEGTLASLSALRTLCAHRDGLLGVSRWNHRVEQQLGASTRERWYAGRPLLVTRNDATLDLMNGDLGVIVRAAGGARAAFAGVDGARLIPPVRLGAIETVHAMTIHKSQGSEFEHVVVVLPPAGSQLLTRELLYTAVTRARRRVTLVGSAAALRAGVAREVARASGLGMAWQDAGP